MNWFLAICGIMVGITSVGLATGSNALTLSAERHTVSLPIPQSQTPVDVSDDADSNELTPTWSQFTVKDGDTLAMLFDRANVSPADLHELITQDKKIKRMLTRLVPDQFIAIKADNDGKLQELVYKTDVLSTTRFERDDKGSFSYSESKRDYDRRITFGQGTIHSSLFEAAKDSGIPESLIMELAGIFGWDVDFALDIREGDRFVVLYEELYLDGKKVRNGNILAAEFVNQGRAYQAIRYTDASGHTDYYTPDGHSLRKAFLRTPVEFTRISSRFGNRYHPILNRMRQHKGVDYAAPRGTPVRASGDGKIIFRGRKGGYGNAIIIKHGGTYSTLYGHLNGFARGIRTGRHVRQGQIIAYVGSTGRATGPHLHYEFRVHGVHRNPLTVRLPKAASINRKYKEAFEVAARPLISQLEQIGTTSVAMSSLQ